MASAGSYSPAWGSGFCSEFCDGDDRYLSRTSSSRPSRSRALPPLIFGWWKPIRAVRSPKRRASPAIPGRQLPALPVLPPLEASLIRRSRQNIGARNYGSTSLAMNRPARAARLKSCGDAASLAVTMRWSLTAPPAWNLVTASSLVEARLRSWGSRAIRSTPAGTRPFMSHCLTHRSCNLTLLLLPSACSSARGSGPANRDTVNAVIARLEPNASADAAAAIVHRWKHLSAITQEAQEAILSRSLVDRARRQIGLFTSLLLIVSAVIIALIIYTMTMEKLKQIATLKLIGAPDRTIIGMIVQQALALGLIGFGIGVALIVSIKDQFPRRVVLEPDNVLVLGLIVFAVCLLSKRTSACVPPSRLTQLRRLEGNKMAAIERTGLVRLHHISKHFGEGEKRASMRLKMFRSTYSLGSSSRYLVHPAREKRRCSTLLAVFSIPHRARWTPWRISCPRWPPATSRSASPAT